MPSSLPSQMRALELAGHPPNTADLSHLLRAVQRPVPTPGPGQVLVRVEASPCNPSDLSFLAGSYESDRRAPCVPGFECSGVVVASGPGLFGKLLRGRRVACASQGVGDGTWAEFCVVDAANCLPLLPGVDFEQGSALIVNPLTALGLLWRAGTFKSRALIQNAAASQLGRMILGLARRDKIPLINIVRRSEQRTLLQQLGAEYVLDSTATTFQEELQSLAQKLGATTALDAVGGTMTGLLLAAVPPGGQVITYGILSGEAPGGIDQNDIVFRGKTLTGFHLGRHAAVRGRLGTMLDALTAQRAVKRGTIRMEVRARVSIEGAAAAIADYAAHMTDGKVIILPALR